jgi:hypothetical protein
MQRKRPQLKARNTRNEGLEMPVLPVTTVCIRFCATKRNSARRDTRGVTRRGERASEEERACGAPLPSPHFHILVVEELTLYVGAHLSQLAMWD